MNSKRIKIKHKQNTSNIVDETRNNVPKSKDYGDNLTRSMKRIIKNQEMMKNQAKSSFKAIKL